MTDIKKYEGIIPAFYACYDVEGKIHPEAVRARIKYLSVASMFSEAIERTYQEVSISKLFR